MLTLIVILLVLWVIRGVKTNNRYKYLRMKLSGFFILLWIAFIGAYFTNILLGPIELAKAQEQSLPLEEKIESLIANFSYVPEEEGSREKLDAFLDEYIPLSNALKEVNAEITRNESRANPHGRGNKIARFFIDFGLF